MAYYYCQNCNEGINVSNTNPPPQTCHNCGQASFGTVPRADKAIIENVASDAANTPDGT